MITTEKFNFIHLPKTGGTFVEAMLRKLYNKKYSKLGYKFYSMLNKAYLRKYFCEDRIESTKVVYGQHGGVRQILNRYKGKPILSIVRNPLDRYASMYKFRWWVQHPEINEKLNFKDIPNYPDFSIKEMIMMYNKLVVQYGAERGLDLTSIGYYTWMFILYYCTDPLAVYQEISSGKADEELNFLRNRIEDIYFLKQENLNQGLVDFLIKVGYAQKNVEFIREAQKVLPQNRGRAESVESWKKYFTNEQVKKILDQDRFLFRCFPFYKIDIA